MIMYNKWDEQRRNIWPLAKHEEFQSWDDFVVVAKYAEGGDWVARNLKAEYEHNRTQVAQRLEQQSYTLLVGGSNPPLRTTIEDKGDEAAEPHCNYLRP